MKATELMVGDWVLDSYDVPQKVRAIMPNSVMLTQFRQTLEQIRPIPILPQFLTQNGFEEDMFYGEMQYDIDPFPLSVVHRNNGTWYLGFHLIGQTTLTPFFELDGIHQLQHFLNQVGINIEIVI